jgi:hypothetical protein
MVHHRPASPTSLFVNLLALQLDGRIVALGVIANPLRLPLAHGVDGVLVAGAWGKVTGKTSCSSGDCLDMRLVALRVLASPLPLVLAHVMDVVLGLQRAVAVVGVGVVKNTGSQNAQLVRRD